MIDELNQAITEYQTKWQQLCEGRNNSAFFESLRPTAVGWKVEDLQDLERRFAELRDKSDQIHFGWVNDRWLITLYLKDEHALPWNTHVVKLMQRRPGSTDSTGLDHFDFLIPNTTNAKTTLEQETGLEWTEEVNGTHCKWISIWFAETEAKLRGDTVLQVCADEMLEFQERLSRNI